MDGKIQLIIPKYDKYEKFDELCSKVHYKLRSNLNLVSDLNENYTAKFNICKIIIFQLK